MKIQMIMMTLELYRIVSYSIAKPPSKLYPEVGHQSVAHSYMQPT